MTSQLIGTKSEELTLEIGPPDVSAPESNFVIWDVSISSSLSECWLPLTQTVRSSLYSLPDIEQLDKLVAGDSSARFVFDVHNFKMELFEHALNSGPRYGYVADCHAYSNNVTQVTDWSAGIADQLLHERWDGAISVRFAFLVGFESLKSFHRQLRIDLASRHPSGG